MSHLRSKSKSSTDEASKPVSKHGEYRRIQFTLLKGHLEHRLHEVNAIKLSGELFEEIFGKLAQDWRGCF